MIRRLRRALAAVAATSACGAALGQQLAANSTRSLGDLSLEDLGKIVVTSVSRREERLADAAASVYVITGEDIRRSTATTLAEALRLAPNLLVARLDAGQYAISARGFNSNVADKLLVLVDGRTIYSPLFAGVFWDAQDVMLEDVERIEVISGPAGSTWGSNAVNGVINVITRSAASTQGALATVASGPRETVAAMRYGGELPAGGAYRVYAKTWRTSDVIRSPFRGTASDWDRAQAGFRSDFGSGRDTFTLQGDVLAASSGARATPNAGAVEAAGGNILGRWVHRADDGAQYQLQAYYDKLRHQERLLLDENGEVLDLELRGTKPLSRHTLSWGVGHRAARDGSDPGVIFSFDPPRRTLSWSNVFAQDQIRLGGNLEATLGLRLERNSFTGWEVLPTARLAWKRSPETLFWAALSRAVRAPSRLDRDIRVVPVIAGGPDTQAEVANVAEIGFRGRLARNLDVSLTAYRQQYDRLKSPELTNGGLPIVYRNLGEGAMTGLEGWATWQVAGWWRVSGGITTIENDLRFRPESTAPVDVTALGRNPAAQWQLRSSMNLPHRQELDVAVRRVGHLAATYNSVEVPAYTAVDLRYGWWATPTVQLSVTATSAFDPAHREWGDTTTSGEISRIVMFRVLWQQ